MAQLDLRLRVANPGLLALPWLEPLEQWSATEVPLTGAVAKLTPDLLAAVADDNVSGAQASTSTPEIL